MKDVLSLRSPYGLINKLDKGWTGATTTIVDRKEVRNRYLFAIEDPFETTHNVARTVTHHGLVAIRDEFRRAWRIILSFSARPGWVNHDGDLMDEMFSIEPPKVQEPLPQVDGNIENRRLSDGVGQENDEQDHDHNVGAVTVASVISSLGFPE